MISGPWLVSFSERVGSRGRRDPGAAMRIGSVRSAFRPVALSGFIASVALAFAASAPVAFGSERAAAPPAPAKTLGLTYEVYAGGLHIFTFDLDLVLEPTGYRIAAEGATRGMTSMLYKWNVKLAAEGEAKALAGKPLPERLRPERYVTVNTGREKPKTMQLAFDATGSFSVVRDPVEPAADDPEEREELPSKLPADIVDPLSAGLVATQTLARTGRCEQTIPVFDGKRRYNLIIHDAGAGTVPKSRGSVYEGPATLCGFTMERISGFSKKKRRYASQWDEDKDEPPTLWLAQVREGMPPVPVRFTGAVSLGSIVVHLTRIEAGTEIASTEPR